MPLPQLLRLNFLNACGAGPFSAFSDFEFDYLAVVKDRPVGFGMMDKKIFASLILFDESVPFFRVEPLNFASWHGIAFVVLFCWAEICQPLREAEL